MEKIFFNEKAYLQGINPKRMGKLMRMIRRYHNMTMSELSRHIGVDRSTISLYENADRVPGLNYVYKFCKLFSITMDELADLTINRSLLKEKEE